MGRFSQLHPSPAKEIRVFQETFDDLVNNTLTIALFDVLNKAIAEGTQIKFVSYGGGEDNEKVIQNEEHLSNYINNIQGMKIV